MHAPSLAPIVLLAIGLAACGTTINDVNLRPNKYYEQKVTLSGRITRTQDLPGELLLELADERERLIYVRVKAPLGANTGDWIKVTGVFVPETEIAGRRVYDVLVAEDISSTTGPWFPNLF